MYTPNFEHEQLKSLELLNHFQKINLANVYPNLCIALSIFYTIPATVANAELSFSIMKRVKNVLRTTMMQQRLSSLGVLVVEARLAKTINMYEAIDDVAVRKQEELYSTI